MADDGVLEWVRQAKSARSISHEPLLVKFKSQNGHFGVGRRDVRSLSLALGISEAEIVHLAIRLLMNHVGEEQMTRGYALMSRISRAQEQNRDVLKGAYVAKGAS